MSQHPKGLEFRKLTEDDLIKGNRFSEPQKLLKDAIVNDDTTKLEACLAVHNLDLNNGFQSLGCQYRYYGKHDYYTFCPFWCPGPVTYCCGGCRYYLCDVVLNDFYIPWTPLMLAVASKKNKIIIWLLEQGYGDDIYDATGRNAMSIAKQMDLCDLSCKTDSCRENYLKVLDEFKKKKEQ